MDCKPLVDAGSREGRARVVLEYNTRLHDATQGCAGGAHSDEGGAAVLRQAKRGEPLDGVAREGARGCIASITTSGTRLEAGGASFGTRSASTLSQAGEEVDVGGTEPARVRSNRAPLQTSTTTAQVVRRQSARVEFIPRARARMSCGMRRRGAR